MNKIFQFLIVFILIILNYKSFAQAGGNNAYNSMPVSVISPQTATLGKYSNYEVNLATGSPNIAIPIYSLNELGINVPISISYDASGFIPNKSTGIVGSNWNLFAGGAITRAVKGVPDEKKSYNPTLNVENLLTGNHTGYIQGIKTGQNFGINQANVENLNIFDQYGPGLYPTTVTDKGTFLQLDETKLNCEYNPDIFTFNFLDFKGKFFMGNDGIIKVISDKKLSVDLTYFREFENLLDEIRYPKMTMSTSGTYPGTSNPTNITDPNHPNQKNLSSIKLTSEDGYIYYFGGSIPNLEFSFVYKSENSSFVVGTSGVINAWYLVKIETPNEESINLEYQKYNEDELKILQSLDYANQSGSVMNKEINCLDVKLSWSDYKSKHSYSNTSTGSSQGCSVVKTANKLAYLKKIITPLKTVSFKYSRAYDVENNTDVNFYSQGSSGCGGGYFQSMVSSSGSKFRTQKLDNILVNSNSGLSTMNSDDEFSYGITGSLKYNFTYQYLGNTNNSKYLFLTEFSTIGQPYKFEYNSVLNLPNSMTIGLDKWGYYNGVTDNTWLIASSNETITSNNLNGEFETNFSQPGQNRLPNSNYTKVGILNKIIYPTGGYTTFEFEGNEYRKILKAKVNSSFGNNLIPELETQNFNEAAGGLRIKFIQSQPGVNKEYKYIKNYSNSTYTNVSSGLLVNNGIFRMRLQSQTNPLNFDETLYDNNINASVVIQDPILSYDEVIEIVGDKTEGYTKNYFSSFETNPNNYIGTNQLITEQYSMLGPLNVNFVNQMKRLVRQNDRSIERGQLIKKEIFDNDDNLKFLEEYKYNINNNRFDLKTVGYENPFNKNGPWISFQNVASRSFLYSSFFLYNYNNHLTKVTTKIFNNGITNQTIKEYFHKSNNDSRLIKQKETAANGEIREVEYFYPEDRTANPSYPLASILMYNKYNNLILEEKNYLNGLLLNTISKKYENIAELAGNFHFKNTEIKTQNNTQASNIISNMKIDYYSDGRIKQAIPRNGNKVVYMWDYKKSLPIAEISNCENFNDVAYTSFETNEDWSSGGYNQWQYNTAAIQILNSAITGAKVLNLTSEPGGIFHEINRQINPNKEYVLSFWFNGSNLNTPGIVMNNGITNQNWVFKQVVITGLSSISISGTGYIDELRLYPKNSLMTTYSYHPLLGLTHKCDINNVLSYFLYDSYCRLSLIRDKDFNIQKMYCYNFNGQATNCVKKVYLSGATQGVFYKTNCQSGFSPVGVLYSVQEGMFSSLVSQADANLQASNFLNTSGSSYAQLNDVCIEIPPCQDICSGVDKKCVNEICELGIRVNIGSYWTNSIDGGTWVCQYRYEWSDGTFSQTLEDVGNYCF